MKNQLRKEIIRLTSGAVYLDGKLVSPETDVPTWVVDSMVSMLEEGLELAENYPNATVDQIAYKVISSYY